MTSRTASALPGAERRARQRALRRLQEIVAEIDAATEKRRELWHELSRWPSPDRAEGVEALSSLIEALWAEARKARVQAHHGPPEQIIARARRYAKAESELNRSLARLAAR